MHAYKKVKSLFWFKKYGLNTTENLTIADRSKCPEIPIKKHKNLPFYLNLKTFIVLHISIYKM